MVNGQWSMTVFEGLKVEGGWLMVLVKKTLVETGVMILKNLITLLFPLMKSK